MSGSQATARSRELLAVEHNDADAAHPGRILLAGGSEAASPSCVPSHESSHQPSPVAYTIAY